MTAPEVTNSGLENLREIILPEPASWMPQAIGWYAVFWVVLLFAGWWVYGRFRRFRADRYRRFALEELEVIEKELQQPEKRANALAEIPVLVKRTALSAFPRTDVAGLSGEKWLAFLDKTMGGREFREGEGQLLAELAYAPRARISNLPDNTICKLLQLVRRWIKIHGPREQ